MLYIFLTFCILLPVFIGYGSILERAFGYFWDGISSKIIAGVVFLATVFTCISFFLPLNLSVEIPTIIIGIILFFYYKLHNEVVLFIRNNKKPFIISLFVCILFGSFYPFILDHFGYYVPTVKWLSEFGLTKGISNLDLLLGQMSFWHVLQAGLSNFADPFLRLNTILMVFYSIYIIEKKKWLHFIFFPLLMLFTQSPSPDLPAIILALILLNEILILNKNATFLFLLSIFVFAVKPTLVWLPIVALLYSLFILKLNIKKLLPGFILLALFFFKNIWTFGYPIFPIALFDFDVAWKPSEEILKISSEFAIQKTYDMQYSIAQISAFSTFDYIKNWLLLPGIKGIIHCVFILTVFYFTFFTFKSKSKTVHFIWLAVILKSIAVLLFSAQYRFFLDVFFVIIFVLIFNIEKQKIYFQLSIFLTVICLIIFSFPIILQKSLPSFKLGKYMLGFKVQQIITPSYFQLKKYSSHTIGNLQFNVVQKYPFSFDTPSPAISPEFLLQDYEASIFPQQIGEDKKEGFISKKLSPEEKAELRNILKQIKEEK